jgi:penicillin V acylase-like amidase (Ntn superfamily)
MSLLRPRLRATSMEQLDETTICHQTNTARSSSGASEVTAFAGLAETCTRALYVGEDGLVITGRSMD